MYSKVFRRDLKMNEVSALTFDFPGGERKKITDKF